MANIVSKRPQLQASFRELFRLAGNLGAFIRANLFVLWIGSAFVLWVFNPVEAFPYPSEVWSAAEKLYNVPTSNNLIYNTYVMLKLNVIGLAIATTASLIIAYLNVIPLFQPLNKTVQLLRYIPVVGFNLAFLTLLAIGWWMKLAMLVTGMTFFLVTSMTGVVADIPRMRYELARVLGYNDWQVFYSVVVRPTLPRMIEAVAANAAIGWIMIVAIETFNRTEGGIGSQICIYNDTNQLTQVYVYLIVIGIIAMAQDLFFSLSKRLLFPYNRIAERS
jgi:ABC-type nitrate/sulfonate/bicarbonate transport system permease component